MAGNNIVIYTSNECQRSDDLIHWLEKHDIDYKEKNISEYRDYLQELQDSGNFGTPTTFVENDTVLGFQPNRMKNKLNL